MPRQARAVAAVLLAGLLLLLAAGPVAARGFYRLPPLPPPHEYGTSLIDRASTASGVPPVVFAHWLHRLRYNCAVCHGELGFNMLVNSTEITEADNRAGRFCGACHNGTLAFAPADNCARCHNGDRSFGREKFELFSKKPYPTTSFGNTIDWVQSLRRGLIAPARYLQTPVEEMPFDRELLLESEMSGVPPAIFPHQVHTDWMNCDTCHPVPFNIKKKTTRHFRMTAILKGEFCGACHLNVAFPMDDCARCHPGMEE